MPAYQQPTAEAADRYGPGWLVWGAAPGAQNSTTACTGTTLPGSVGNSQSWLPIYSALRRYGAPHLHLVQQPPPVGRFGGNSQHRYSQRCSVKPDFLVRISAHVLSQPRSHCAALGMVAGLTACTHGPTQGQGHAKGLVSQHRCFCTFAPARQQ